MLLDRLIDRLPVIDAVSYKTVNFSINLIQKIRHLRWILFGPTGNFGSHNPAILVHTNMQFLPTLIPSLSVLPRVPFSLTTYIETCAIHDETYWTVWKSIDITLYIHCSIAPG
jgi:hypothetical protein